MKNKIQRFAGFIIVGIILIVLATAIIDREDKKLTYSELISKIELSEVTEIEISGNGKSAYIKLKGETLEKEVNIPNMESFMDYITDYLKAGNIKLTENSENILITILGLISPFGIIIIALLFLFFTMSANSQNGGSKSVSFGKSKARMLNSNDKNK